ncbi:MAG: hypothetical protein K1X88_17065 [Nannocystaceae bacterium]|nr:hypothetical protein [Nannocystaceae bacterium]
MSLALACDRAPADKPAVAAAGTATAPGKAGATPPSAPVRKAVQVAAGMGSSCARMDDGSVRCWGRNDYGELGNGAMSPTDAATPVVVAGVSGSSWIGMGGDPGDQGDLACSIAADGGVTCWGYTRLLPVEGANPGTPTAIPALRGAKEIAFGGGTLYAAMADGTVVGWGNTTFNALGDGDTSGNDKGPTTIPGIRGATHVAGGQNHGCAVVTGGKVLCWGYVGTQQAAKEVPGLSGVTAIAATAGSSQTCAIDGSGAVQCWDEDMGTAALPGLGDAVALSARSHWCARRKGGALSCWGANDRGQLGLGKPSDGASEPTAVTAATAVVDVSVGSRSTCIAHEDGHASCFGYNQRGQLGDGTLMDRAGVTTVVELQAATPPAPSDGRAQTQEASVAMDWAGLPAACTRPDALTVVDPRFEGEYSVRSAYASLQFEGKTLALALANYAMDPARTGEAPRGGQLQIAVRLGNVDLQHDRTPLPIDLGVYSLDTTQARLAWPTLTDRAGGVSIGVLTLAGAKAGTVELTHLDAQWVCGTLALGDGTRKVEGPFAARITAGR